MSGALRSLYPDKTAFASLQDAWMREWHIAALQGLTIQTDALLVDKALGIASAARQAGLQQHLGHASTWGHGELLHLLRQLLVLKKPHKSLLCSLGPGFSIE